MLRHAPLRLVRQPTARLRAVRGLTVAIPRPAFQTPRDAISSGSARYALSSLSRTICSSSILRAEQPFKLADIGEGITEVSVVKWLVKEGDEIEEFDALCEVQSDKSTVELTAPFTGTVKAVKFAEGDMITVGQVICTIATDAEGSEEGASAGDAENSSVDNAETPESSATSPSTADSTPEPITPAQSSAPPDAIETQPPAAANEYYPQPPTESDPSGPVQIRRTAKGEIIIPAPPPRQVVRPAQLPSESMSTLDRALLASMRAAAEAGEAADAALEAADLLAGSTQPSFASSTEASGAFFSGEGSVVRQEAPKREVNTAPVPERQAGGGTARDIVKASPAVRVMAARLGVKLEDVRATGPDGRVTQQDVQNSVPRPSSPAQASNAKATSRAAPSVPAQQLAVSPERSQIPEVTKVEFGRTRKVMYRAMGDQAHVPHFGYSHTLNLTPLLPYIKALNSASTPAVAGYLASDIPASQARSALPDMARPKTTLLSFLVKGLLLAMEEHPIMRARAREQGSSRFLDIGRDGVVGVAVSDPKFGLVTPSLPRLPPHAGLSTITSALSVLRQNPTKPTSPANITISSVGGLGEARDAMPVLPPGGGLAICAVGRARWEVEWKQGKSKTMDWSPEEIEAAGTEAVLRCPVGWSGDHRVLEGAELIAFTETWKKYIEEPWRWLNVD